MASDNEISDLLIEMEPDEPEAMIASVQRRYPEATFDQITRIAWVAGEIIHADLAELRARVPLTTDMQVTIRARLQVVESRETERLFGMQASI